jgi:4-amino-4-deoxy-L-arabinose transferase-like glycosyltransferase
LIAHQIEIAQAVSLRYFYFYRLTLSNRTNRLQASAIEPGDKGFSAPAVAAFVFVAVVFIAGRLWRLTSYGLFGDELFSLWAAQHDWSGLLAAVINDIDHPPLFYLLLKAWMMVGGESALWLKLFPVLISIAAIIPFFLLCRELKMTAAAINLAIALMAVNAYLILYSQELRMYSLLLFFTTASLWLFVKFFNAARSEKKILLALFAANLLLVYTHYYGWLVVGVEFLFLILWARAKLFSFALACVGLIACFSPWAYLVAQAAMEKGGLGFPSNAPGIRDLVWFHQSLNGPVSYRWEAYVRFSTALLIGGPILVLVFDGPILFWGWELFKKGERKQREQAGVFRLLVLFSFLPLAIVFCASHLMAQAAWATRYLIIAVPSYMILLAVAATRLRPKWIKSAAVILILAWAALSGFIELNNREKIAWEPLIREMIQAEPVGGGVTRIYTSDYNVISTIDYYLGRYNEPRFEVKFTNDLTAPEENHYWIAILKYRNDPHPLPQSSMREKGFALGDGFKVDTLGPRAYLFPIWRRTSGDAPAQ